MVKGVSIKLETYNETVPKVLGLIKLDQELKKHATIIIKPSLAEKSEESTAPALVEQIARFCLQHKNPEAEIFIAEGSDGHDTMDLFSAQGYRALAERYGFGLLDLNKAESETMGSNDFVGFETLFYPSILKNSFVISVPRLGTNESMELFGSLANMRAAFPGKHYKGFFSNRKSKLDAYPMKYQIHDIVVAKMPQLAVIDAPAQGKLLVGKPLDIDKQAAQLLSMDARSIGYLRMIEETLETQAKRELAIQEKTAPLAS